MLIKLWCSSQFFITYMYHTVSCYPTRIVRIRRRSVHDSVNAYAGNNESCDVSKQNGYMVVAVPPETGVL